MLIKLVKTVFRKLPASLKDRLYFRRVFGRFPNLKKPKTFNEKILFRKINACITDPVYSTLADKFLIRNYVEKKIGSEYLVELLGKTKSAITLREIIAGHSGFVLKPNHGAGMVEICDVAPDDKKIAELTKKASEWLAVDYSKVVGEKHYSSIERMILMEKRIGNKGDILTDYKLHLFKKKNNQWFYVLQIIDERFSGQLARTFYVNNIDKVYSGNHPFNPENKTKIEELISLSKILIDDLEYARIDWYIHDNKLYFGEVTLTPAAGLGTGYGTALDALMGEHWDLSLAPR